MVKSITDKKEMKDHPVWEMEHSTEMKRATISQFARVELIQNSGSLLNIYTVIIHSRLCRCRIPTAPSRQRDEKEEY